MFLKHAPVEVKHEAYVAQILKKLTRSPYGVYNHELADISWKFTAYISVLRKRGYMISAIRIDKGSFKYYLEKPEIRKSER